MTTIQLITSTVLCTALNAAVAQQQVVFDRNKKTEVLFDESNPHALVSILQQNAEVLKHYNLKGMDSEVYAGLSDAEKALTYEFRGPQSDIPLLDEKGKPMILTLPDGSQEFLYPQRDSMFIDLHGIDRIVFTLNAGNESPYERLKELQLWKNYGSSMYRVLSIDAPLFMQFEGLNLILPMSEHQQDKIMGKHGEPSLWAIMRDTSLQQMKGYQLRLTDGVFEERLESASTAVLSHLYWWRTGFMPVDRLRKHVEQGRFDLDPEFGSYFDYNRTVPFSSGLIDSVRSYQITLDALKERFDETHYILTQDMIPLINDYGEEILVRDEDGIYRNVYPEPKEEYFFFDYAPTIMVAKQVRYESPSKYQLVPTHLLFCLENGTGKPSLISVMSLDFDKDDVDRTFLKPYVADLTPENLWNLPTFIQLKTLINNKKYLKQ